jgi:hypothetical protein
MSAVDFIRQPLAQTLSNKENIMNKIYSATIENGKLMCNGFALQSAANEANNEHGQKEGISWAEAVAQGRTIHVSERGQAALDSIPGKITPVELDETPIEDLIGESTLIKLVEGERDQKPFTQNCWARAAQRFCVKSSKPHARTQVNRY